jgi:hypothetical protein
VWSPINGNAQSFAQRTTVNDPSIVDVFHSVKDRANKLGGITSRRSFVSRITDPVKVYSRLVIVTLSAYSVEELPPSTEIEAKVKIV